MPDHLNQVTLDTLIQQGATSCHFKENQIILYGEHLPAGIYIITSGDIIVYSASRGIKKKGSEMRLNCDRHFIILPSIEYLNRKSLIQAMAISNCKALFVPKSIVQNNKSISVYFNRSEPDRTAKYVSSIKIMYPSF